MPGITINTLWGEMAAQLAESAGDLKLYDCVKEADKKGVSPGSEAIKNLFDACGPCLVLMDELVASIPESEIEIGGTAGKVALETIEHTFGRMESIWKPVAANEGFEVVRRRLFLDCKDPDGRDTVCSKFSQMYAENQSDFPMESRELEYKERMISCYPIHPEIFDRLYEDWATLERFQRTRGILRLMAAVIHELWMGNDAGLMMLPSASAAATRASSLRRQGRCSRMSRSSHAGPKRCFGWNWAACCGVNLPTVFISKPCVQSPKTAER